MLLGEAGCVFVALLLLVAVAQGQDVFYGSDVCALKGSSVDIYCIHTYPSYLNGHYATVPETFWHITKDHDVGPVDLREDPEYAGRVEYHDKWRQSTLRITDLRESDSDVYKFRFITEPGGRWFGKSGVTLSVTALQVKVAPTTVTEGQRVKLTCSTSCPLSDKPTYIWYKNSQPVTQPESQQDYLVLETVSSEDAGSYSCAVKGHEDLRAPQGTLTVTYKPKNVKVSVSPSGEIVEGSSVTLTCSSDANPPVYEYTWYKENVDSPIASGQNYTMTDFRSEDSGEHYCEARNKVGAAKSSIEHITVAGKSAAAKNAAIGVAVASLGLTALLLSYLWFKKKKILKSTSQPSDPVKTRTEDSGPLYNNVSAVTMRPVTAAQTETTEQQDDLHYASVHVTRSKNQEVPLYSTVQPAQQLQRQEEDVQYAAVNFNNRPDAAPRTRGQTAEEDPPGLYSTVSKPTV